MKTDKIDLKILFELDYNARIPLSTLAKNVSLSKQNTNYRLNRLIKEKIILGFVSLIDIHRLGYFTYRAYFRYKNVNAEREQNIINSFNKNKNIIWFVTLLGSWDLETVFAARNIIHFNNILKEIKEEFGEYFSKYNLSASAVNYHFKKDYLINKKRDRFNPSYYGFEPKLEQIDELNKTILKELSINCRQSNTQIAKKINTTYHTVKERIKRLENIGIIQSHRYLLDINKLQRKYYKATITLNNPSKIQEQSILTFCSQYNSVTYLVEVIGEWQLEIEAEVESEEDFTSLLKDVRNKFPALITDYTILRIIQEHKLNYYPF